MVGDFWPLPLRCEANDRGEVGFHVVRTPNDVYQYQIGHGSSPWEGPMNQIRTVDHSAFAA